jgi:hypothetical protein
MLNSGRAALKL